MSTSWLTANVLLIVVAVHLNDYYFRKKPEDGMAKMENKCKELKQQQFLQRQQLSRLYVNEQRKYIYCVIPKVGSTSWAYTLLKLAGKKLSFNSRNYAKNVKLQSLLQPQNLRKFIRRVSYYNRTTRNVIIKTYYKFMFVREPLERLISAYKYSILQHHAAAMTKIVKSIKKQRQSLNSTIQG